MFITLSLTNTIEQDQKFLVNTNICILWILVMKFIYLIYIFLCSSKLKGFNFTTSLINSPLLAVIVVDMKNKQNGIAQLCGIMWRVGIIFLRFKNNVTWIYQQILVVSRCSRIGLLRKVNRISCSIFSICSLLFICSL